MKEEPAIVVVPETTEQVAFKGPMQVLPLERDLAAEERLEDDDSLISKILKSEDEEMEVAAGTESDSVPDVISASDSESQRARMPSGDGEVDSFISSGSGSENDPEEGARSYQAYQAFLMGRRSTGGGSAAYRGSSGSGNHRSPPRRTVRLLDQSLPSPSVAKGMMGVPRSGAYLPPPQAMGCWPPPECYYYGAPPGAPMNMTSHMPGPPAGPWGMVFYDNRGANPAILRPPMGQQQAGASLADPPAGANAAKAPEWPAQAEQQPGVTDLAAVSSMPPDMSNARNVAGQSALHLAAASAFVAGVKILVSVAAELGSR